MQGVVDVRTLKGRDGHAAEIEGTAWPCKLTHGPLLEPSLSLTAL